MTVTLVVTVAAIGVALLSAFTEAVRHTGDHAGDAQRSENWLVQRLASRPRIAHVAKRRLDPNTLSGLAITVGFGIVAVTAVVVGVLFDWIDGNDGRNGLARLDRSLAEWGADNATESSTNALRALTDIGSTTVAFVLVAAAASFDYFRNRNPHVFSFAALVAVGQLALIVSLKAIVGRERPAIAQLVDVASPSFPSGHACTAAACIGAVAFITTRLSDRGIRSLVAAISIGIAVAVAASRVLLGVHWLTDVVAGLAVGWGWLLLLIVLFSRQLRPLAPMLQSAVSGDVESNTVASIQ